MNHHQKQYALNRIKDVQKIKLDEAKEKLRIKEIRLRNDKRIDLIYKGKVKLISRENVREYTDLANAYDFSEYETKGGYKPEYAPLVIKINDVAQNAKDQIMLGDCEEALKLIKQLENIKV